VTIAAGYMRLASILHSATSPAYAGVYSMPIITLEGPTKAGFKADYLASLA
jgi:hypothetical protein